VNEAGSNDADQDPAELERRLREILSAHGFAGTPYARLLVLVYLVRAFADHGYRLELKTAHKTLGPALGISATEARAALRDIRKAGCFLSEGGRPLLAFGSTVERICSDDALELDEICIDAMTRVAAIDIPQLHEEPMRSMFRRVVGAWPSDTAGLRRTALEHLRASATAPVASGGVIVEMARALQDADFDPAPLQRGDVIDAVIEILGTSADLTAEQLAQEISATAGLSSAPDVIHALLAARAFSDADGLPVSSATEPIAAVVADRGALEAACIGAYRDYLERTRPHLFADVAIAESCFNRIVTQAAPLTAAEIRRILDNVGLHPHPNVRHAILAELDILTASRARALPYAGLAREVAARVPVSRAQVWHILEALEAADAVSNDEGDPPRSVRSFTRRSVGELDELLIALFVAEIRKSRPDAVATAGGLARVRRLLGARQLSEDDARTPAQRELRRLGVDLPAPIRRRAIGLAIDATSDGAATVADVARTIGDGTGLSRTRATRLLRILGEAEILLTLTPGGKRPVVAFDTRVLLAPLGSDVDTIDAALVRAVAARLSDRPEVTAQDAADALAALSVTEE
jgi:hypothetical protein